MNRTELQGHPDGGCDARRSTQTLEVILVALQFNTPPGWPAAPDGWYPDPNWRPDPSWPPAPDGWSFWTQTQTPPEPPAPPAPLMAVPNPPLPNPRTPEQRTHSRWWAKLAWIPTLLFGVATYLIVLQVMITTQNPILFPTLLFIGAITVPASVLMLVYGLGHRVGNDGVLVVATAVVGGIIGVIGAGQLEAMFVPTGPGSSPLATYVTVAVIEETVKMIVPVAIFLFLRRRSPGLGVVLGIAAGAGFAVLETMGYGFTVLLTTSGNLAVVDQTLMLRALLAPASHVAWTGIIAAALWRTADPSKQFRGSVLIGAIVTAIALHTAWDATNVTAVQFGVALTSLAVLMVAVVTSIRAQRVPPTVAQPIAVMAPPVIGQRPFADVRLPADVHPLPEPVEGQPRPASHERTQPHPTRMAS